MRFLLFLFYFIFSLASEYALAQNYGGWEIADSLIFPRLYHASVALPNGDILVTGGEDTVFMKQCEIYNYQTQKWSMTTPMISGRIEHDLVLLKNGKVMAVGGYKNRSCEIFNTIDETWELADSLLTSRTFGQTVTMLNNGNILIAGGHDHDLSSGKTMILNECEIYDYQENRWYLADSLNHARKGHTMNLLPDGRILVAGGLNYEVNELSSCEIYDPENSTWTEVASLNQKRYDHAAILLNDGKILVSGGLVYDDPMEPWQRSCEVYDPLKDEWTVVGSMAAARDDHKMVYIDSVNLLIFSGAMGYDLWEVYDAVNFIPIHLDSYPVRKQIPTFHLLPDGKVLSIGGLSWIYDDGMPLVFPCRMCEIYIPHLTSIKNENNTLENKFSLFQNYPNPFNHETEIIFSIPQEGLVTLSVYDLQGRLVKTLFNGYREAGQFNANWNGTNAAGETVASGLYFYRLKFKKQILTRKMFLVR